MQDQHKTNDFWGQTLLPFIKKAKCVLGKFFLRTSFGQCLLIAAITVVILEMLGFQSPLQGLLYPFTHPIAFLINTFLIALTFSIATPFKRRYFGYLVLFVFWLALGIVNCVLLSMRVTPFEAADLYIITTGFSIITVYLKTWQIIAIGIAIGLCLIALGVTFFKVPKTELRSAKDSLIAIVSLIVLTCGTIISLRMTGVVPRTVPNIADAYKDYGFAYCFTMGFIDRGINEPEDYNAELIGEISDLIGKADDRPQKTPNVIFVQMESFFNVNRLEGVTYSKQPMPNYVNLMENYPSGYLTVPSIGAGTANTEFEVLTGMSLDYFGMGEYPYKSVLRNSACESLATMFKDCGYTAHAIHNHSGTFYARNTVYPNLGFDTFISSEFMPNIERNVLTWAKDKVLTEEIVRALDSTENTSDFVFTVSVQGHGRYPTEYLDYERHVTITDGISDTEEKNRYEYFVNQMYEMDAFIGALTEAVTERREETVIVFYGDHLPSLGIEDDDLNEQTVYQTEYVIWSNYTPENPLPDRDISTYQLGAYAMRQLGITTGVTNRFHNYYFDLESYDEDDWNRRLHALQYDMLYGNYYIYGAKNPFKRSDMRMGVVDILVTDCELDGEQAIVRGNYFTEFSVVYVNGEALETRFVSPTELIVTEGEEITKGKKLKVVQVATDMTKLGSSNQITVS